MLVSAAPVRRGPVTHSLRSDSNEKVAPAYF